MKRTTTHDFDSTEALDAVRLKFFTVESLGKSQHLTPEGFLVCLDVPIARTGTMLYGPGEVPVPVGPDGHTRIIRDEDEVFNPAHIMSYAGKPVVDEHPDEDVRPDNWRELAVGTAMNPRRGTGMQGDLLIADLMITDPEVIKAVIAGKREISCGYEADYEEVSPGVGRQLNLIGNHVALVDAGRCGSRCAIGDSERFSQGETDMAKPKWIDKLRAAFMAKDAEGFEKSLEEAKAATGDAEGEEGGEGTHVHLHQGEEPRRVTDDQLEEHMSTNAAEHEEFRSAIAELQAQIAAMSGAGSTDEKSDEEKAAEAAKSEDADPEAEEELAEEAPPGTQDKARKARDSVYMEDSFQGAVAAAEILAPGIRIPTFDRSSNPKATLDTVCKLRRSALDTAYATSDGRAIVHQINGDKPLQLSGMKCNAVRSLFNAAVALKRVQNNMGTRDQNGREAPKAIQAGVKTLAELNALNAKRWSGKA